MVNALFKGHAEVLASDMSMRRIDPEGWTLVGFLMLAWALKPLLTGVTLGAGGVAGCSPLRFFVGGCSGTSLPWFPGGWAPCGRCPLAMRCSGIAGLLAGVLHAPLTAILLAAEVSGGYALFVPVMLTSGISFQLSKWWMRNSVYT